VLLWTQPKANCMKLLKINKKRGANKKVYQISKKKVREYGTKGKDRRGKKRVEYKEKRDGAEFVL